jgi:non-heme chloroperoxidase
MVTSTDRTRLAVYTAGPVDAPLLLLVHGWAQSAACWRHQFDDGRLTSAFRVAALDLRGHGASDKPAAGYDDPEPWADDLAAVLDAALDANAQPGGKAVLVGWSYGGLVIGDYLSVHGTHRTAGVLLTGAITGLGRGVRAGRIGPVMRAALPDALDEDPAVAAPALRAFVDGMSPRLPAAERQELLQAALDTPPHVRRALFDRTVDRPWTAQLPVLVQHGTADPVVDASTAEHHLDVIKNAEADWWPGAGHALFAEDPARFDRTLDSFARRCTADRERMTT